MYPPAPGYDAKLLPSRLNVNPKVDEVTVIVPVEIVQFGCVILTVGSGMAGGSVTITGDAVAKHV